jgi:probable rRNA maturation factor
MARVNFFTEDIDFKVPFPRKTATWIQQAITKEKKQLYQLNYVFCSDDYLHQINQQYLNHRSLTDIITFDNSEGSGKLEGDIFISIDRVKENSQIFLVPFDIELRRVIIHGALHLIGYSDKTEQAKAVMRKKEDAYLSLFK